MDDLEDLDELDQLDAELEELAAIEEEDRKQEEEEKTTETKKRFQVGCKREELYSWVNWKKTKEVEPIDQRETVFGVSEYILETIKTDPSNIEEIIKVPKDADLQLFLFESMKIFLTEVGIYIALLSDECNLVTCSKMQATTKFRYRCSAHKRPKDCSAIQYSLHTLDLFTDKLTSKDYSTRKNFMKKKLMQDIGNLCRRVYRIFAHAYYHHKDKFSFIEASSFLCSRFIMFFQKYRLIDSKMFEREIQIPEKDLYFSVPDRKTKASAVLNRQNRLSHKANQIRKQSMINFIQKDVATALFEDQPKRKGNLMEMDAESDDIF